MSDKVKDALKTFGLACLSAIVSLITALFTGCHF